MSDQHGQVRLEWGPTGAASLVGGGSSGAEVAVVVDVLSFTTTLTVALERGITVLPFAWRDERASAYAGERDAVLATGRLEGGAGVSLSPASMQAAEGVQRVVLPSPNGSSICFGLRDAGALVVGACLRNRAAVAGWLAPRVAAGDRVAVVAAGERWSDGTLRPAAEDLWGAGAVLDLLPHATLSVEARLAASAFAAVRSTLGPDLLGCTSGHELVAKGFAEDVRIAAELDACGVVPVLDGEGFVDRGSQAHS